MGNLDYRRNKQKPVNLTTKQTQMIVQCTGLTESEVINWHRGFIKDCPTGRLKMDQFQKFYGVLYPGGQSEKFCRLAFQAFDKNRDGTIDFSEFVIAVTSTLKGDPRQKLEMAFDMYDNDGNQLIDERELAQMMEALLALKGEHENSQVRAKKILDCLDLNGDRKISRDEFISGCLADESVKRLLYGDTSSIKSSQSFKSPPVVARSSRIRHSMGHVSVPMVTDQPQPDRMHNYRMSENTVGRVPHPPPQSQLRNRPSTTRRSVIGWTIPDEDKHNVTSTSGVPPMNSFANQPSPTPLYPEISPPYPEDTFPSAPFPTRMYDGRSKQF